MNDTLRKKIASLLAKARDHGASEAEAMAAAARAAELMREHGLSDDDVEFEEAEAPLKFKTDHPRAVLLGAIARCTNCAAMLHSDWTPAVTFFGRAPGPEVAAYLTVVCNRAIDREITAFKKSSEYRRRRTLSTRRQAVSDFTIGMVARLSNRLRDMFAASIDDDAYDQAKAVRDGRHPSLGSVGHGGRKVRFGSAAAAGYSAARDVQLAHGVNGGRPVQQLGS